MRNKDAFSGYHPAINFLYYALVLLFSMCLMHPVYLAISLTGALAYDVYLKGKKAVRFAVMGLLPMTVIAALGNPAFTHEGQTMLTYLPSGNPLTLESILYGVAAAVMLASVVLWFSSYNEIMTSDKFVYLFGRMIPALSLVLSMALRFIPKFKSQMEVVSEAQSCIGRDTKTGSVLRRVGNAVKIFSIMVTWSLENAIETADSMRSRGYGLPGRTAFSIYRFDDRDKTALAWLIFCGAYLISGWMAGGTYFRYYPTVKAAVWNPMTVSFMCVYLALVLTPVILDRKEDTIYRCPSSRARFWCFAAPRAAANRRCCGSSKPFLPRTADVPEKFCLREEISILLTSANRQKKSASCSKAPKTRSSRIRSGMSWRSGWNPSAMTRRRFAAVLPKWQVSSASRRGFISPSLRFRAVKSSS